MNYSQALVGVAMSMSKPPYYFQLETPGQVAALAALEPTSGKGEEFRCHVLLQLETIHKVGTGRPKKGVLESPATAMRELRRRAKTAQRVADSLEEQSSALLRSSFFTVPEPPAKELRQYAQDLREQADTLQKVSPSSGGHRIHRQTIEIMWLVAHVEQETGRPHWKRLAVLIQAATGDASFNEDRLRKMIKYHRKKYYDNKRTRHTAKGDDGTS